LARGTQHRKRRPADHARAGRSAALTPPAKPKAHAPQWQEELFFARLRNHAKWVFVLLALVFALGFVVFGVGSGSNGISDALQSAFNFGGGGGTSISKARKAALDHPLDPGKWQDLAVAYEQKQQWQDAVDALNHLVSLRPKDADALQELAGDQTQLQNQVYSDLVAQQATAAALVPAATFQPSTSTAIGKALANGNPLEAALEAQANTNLSNMQEKLVTAEAATEGTYKKLAALTPNDANAQLLLGQSAQNAGDNATAIKAYKAFLKLAPTDPEAAQVKSQLKSLTATSTGTGSSPSG
jgi:tetratricopeptide (TPR) repeat protein